MHECDGEWIADEPDSQESCQHNWVRNEGGGVRGAAVPCLRLILLLEMGLNID